MAHANHQGSAESATIAEEAATWFVRLRDTALSDAQRRDFGDWLSRSPAHAAAFDDMAQVWTGLDALPTDAFVPVPAAPRSWILSRRQWLAGAATAAGVTAAGAWVMTPSGDITAPFRTPRSIVLAEGAALDLDSLSAIALMAGAPQPTARLRHGQVFAQVTRPAGQGITLVVPFGAVHAEAAAFNLKIERRRALLSVKSGQVTVERQKGGTVTLNALTELPFGAEVVDPVRKIPATHVAPWRDGSLIFNRTLLVDAIDDINRYRPGRVWVGDPRLDDRPVTGHFEIVDADSALATLMAAFSLKSLNFGTSIRVLFPA